MSGPQPLLTSALTGELTIPHAADQQRVLLDALATREITAGSHWTLDLGAIEACDSAGVQLLLATRLSLVARDAALQLEPLGTSVHEALRTYGLGPDLQPLPSGDPA